MTIAYFVRHCQPDFAVHDDLTRPLTAKGLEDRKLVNAFLEDKAIDAVVSSPCRRAIETVQDFAERNGHPIQIVNDFRERKVDNVWIEDFRQFSRKQWQNYSYKLENGESLGEVQARNVQALHRVLVSHSGKNVVIGSHGTALSTIIHFYQPNFGFEYFERIQNLMPWIVRFAFEDDRCTGIRASNVFSGETEQIL